MTMEQVTNRFGETEADQHHYVNQTADIRPPIRDEIPAAHVMPARLTASLERTALMSLAIFLMSFIGLTVIFVLPDLVRDILRNGQSPDHVVSQIIHVESNGCVDVKNERSTASGPGQFIEATWMHLIRKHRPDLANLPRGEVLAMRHDAALSREMTARFAEGNASVLRRHGHTVTPASLYLSHFAGSAGAVAILSAPETADAAQIMANADATGRITRDKIVTANPFLSSYTIADLKAWADRKMRKKLSYRAMNQSCPS